MLCTFRSFEVLANAIGFKKSFSTSDILGIEASQPAPFLPNRCHSDVHLSEAAILFRLEASSRSLSTWVAVGDTSATTQLPSPQVSCIGRNVSKCLENVPKCLEMSRSGYFEAFSGHFLPTCYTNLNFITYSLSCANVLVLPKLSDQRVLG